MTSPPPTEKWHHHYDNPSDDLVFKSSDNVKFRLSSHFVAKSSTVFKDMLSVPNAKTKTVADNVIDIELDAYTFERFLDLTSVTAPEPIIKAMTFDVCRKLLPFTEKYDCHRLSPLLLGQLTRTGRFPGKALDYLLFASDRNDPQMGAQALENIDLYGSIEDSPLTNSILGPRSGKIRAYLKPLRPEWRHLLIELVFERMVDENPHIALDWKQIASKFEQACRYLPKKANGETDAGMHSVEPQGKRKR